MNRFSKLLLICSLSGCSIFGGESQQQITLTSPDHNLSANIYISTGHKLVYSVSRDSEPVVLESQLGLDLKGADFTQGVEISSKSSVQLVNDHYQMAVGKKRDIHYQANEQTFHIVNAQHQKMDVTFRLSNDGVAFRYQVSDLSIGPKEFIKETTSFHFPATAKAWMQPITEAKTGWNSVNPTYEEHYSMGVPVGTPSPIASGWVFPALFNTGANTWALITEANMDGSWHASRLLADSTGGEYHVGPPMDKERFTGQGLLAHSDKVLTSPWRILAVGSMPTLMESTLGTDLAAPAISFDKNLVKPGHASWSWPLLKDDYTIYSVQKKFIDYAADMKWNYTLIDADWDRQIGYDKVKELIDYATKKGVGILLWYNSAGDWNTTPNTPRNKLLSHESRVKEFSLLHSMGAKGIKVDFFGGDGQSMIAYYIDILKDAADYGLLVNFHGATLPRGWARTYPNLMTTEAVRGLEYTTFGQDEEDVVASHAVMSIFVRNVFDPMDFTPMVFADIPNIKRSTRNGFELAESVLFLSGIQHFAEIPEGMATVPAYVKHFLQVLPNQWDDVKYIDGYPGKYVVLARKAGDHWYIAGINAGEQPLELKLDLSFINGKQGQMISDGEAARDFSNSSITASSATSIVLKDQGGFVTVF